MLSIIEKKRMECVLSTPQDDNGAKVSMTLWCNPKFQQMLKHLLIFTVEMT